MVNDPKEAVDTGDSTAFMPEAIARLRIAAAIVSDEELEFDGFGLTVARELIEDVAGSLEAFGAAHSEAFDKAKAAAR